MDHQGRLEPDSWDLRGLVERRSWAMAVRTLNLYEVADCDGRRLGPKTLPGRGQQQRPPAHRARPDWWRPRKGVLGVDRGVLRSGKAALVHQAQNRKSAATSARFGISPSGTA